MVANRFRPSWNGAISEGTFEAFEKSDLYPFGHLLRQRGCPEHAASRVRRGLDDEKRDDPRSSVTFEIYGDVKEMGEQPVLLGQSPVLSSKTVRAWSFQVDLNTRFKELRIVVTDAGDGIASDHADLVEAGFVTKGR